jgi:uncharacterized membrane protein YraQ (UPF0718 family)
VDFRTVEELLSNFASIIYEALPFIVIGVVIAGLLEEFVPQQAINRIMPKNKYLAIALGGVLGIIFPMCECGIIVVMKRLLRKGLPLSVCVCYMLAGPVINLVVMVSTYAAFNQKEGVVIFGGPEYVVLLRVGFSFIVAFVTALVVDVQFKKYGTQLFHLSVVRGLRQADDEAEGPKAPQSWWQSVDHITETALHDFVDIMAFLVLGACLAVLGRAWMEGTNLGGDIKERITEFPSLGILLMMAFAILFCLCSEADAFVCANFPLFWPPASKLAFLVLGPMLDLKLYMMYTRVFRPRLIYTIILTVCVQVFVYTMIVHYCSYLPVFQKAKD